MPRRLLSLGRGDARGGAGSFGARPRLFAFQDPAPLIWVMLRVYIALVCLLVIGGLVLVGFAVYGLLQGL